MLEAPSPAARSPRGPEHLTSAADASAPRPASQTSRGKPPPSEGTRHCLPLSRLRGVRTQQAEERTARAPERGPPRLRPRPLVCIPHRRHGRCFDKFEPTELSRDRKEQHRHQRDKPKDGSSGSSHSPGPSQGCSLLSCGALVDNRGRLISAVPLARPRGRASPSRGRERAAVGGRQPRDTASRSAVCRPLGLRQGPGLPSLRVFPHPTCPRRVRRPESAGSST